MADNDVYGFSRTDAMALLQNIGGKAASQDSGMPGGRFIIQTPSGGIVKRSGNTVTFADCAVFYLAGTGTTRTLTSAGFNVPVGNLTNDDLPGSTFLSPDQHGGALVCNPSIAGKLFLTTSTISARTGSGTPWTPGNGLGTALEFYNDSGTIRVRTTSVTGVTLRHMGTATIASGRIVQAKFVDGQWLIDVDYC